MRISHIMMMFMMIMMYPLRRIIYNMLETADHHVLQPPLSRSSQTVCEESSRCAFDPFEFAPSISVSSAADHHHQQSYPQQLYRKSGECFSIYPLYFHPNFLERISHLSWQIFVNTKKFLVKFFGETFGETKSNHERRIIVFRTKLTIGFFQDISRLTHQTIAPLHPSNAKPRCHHRPHFLMSMGNHLYCFTRL